GGAPFGSANRRTHALWTLKRAVRELGMRTIDQRTSVGRDTAKWRADLIEPLGGGGNVSAHELAIISVLQLRRPMLNAVGAWIAEQNGRLVNRKTKAAHPVLQHWSTLASAFTRDLERLGLKRRAREVDSLEQIIAEHDAREAAIKSEAPP